MARARKQEIRNIAAEEEGNTNIWPGLQYNHGVKLCQAWLACLDCDRSGLVHYSLAQSGRDKSCLRETGWDKVFSSLRQA